MGEVRKLRTLDNAQSGGVTFPKETLKNAGLVDENGEVTEAHIFIEEEDAGEWRIRALDLDK